MVAMTLYTRVLDVRMLPLLVPNPCGQAVMEYIRLFNNLINKNLITFLVNLKYKLYLSYYCFRLEAPTVGVRDSPWQIAGFRSYYILIVVALTSAPKLEIDPYM